MRARTFAGAAAASLFLLVCQCASQGSDGGSSPVVDSGSSSQQGDSGPDATLEDTAPAVDTSPPVDTGTPFTTDSATKDSAQEGSSEDSSLSDGSSESSTDGAPESGAETGPSDSDGGVPTTCTQADNKIGCCSASGVLYYCETTTLASKTCTGGKVCGWDSTSSYYGCVASPGSADPSGTYPIACK